jgi:hypothetical protein
MPLLVQCEVHLPGHSSAETRAEANSKWLLRTQHQRTRCGRHTQLPLRAIGNCWAAAHCRLPLLLRRHGSAPAVSASATTQRMQPPSNSNSAADTMNAARCLELHVAWWCVACCCLCCLRWCACCTRQCCAGTVHHHQQGSTGLSAMLSLTPLTSLLPCCLQLGRQPNVLLFSCCFVSLVAGKAALPGTSSK